MFIRVMSDLHNEFTDFVMEELDTDKDDILILAGDIGVAAKLPTFHVVKAWANRFRKVIQICGNHEYYHGSLLTARQKIIEFYKGIDNLVLADNEVIRVDDVSFICSTLWTDFMKGNPMVMEAIRNGLNDYTLIRTGNLSEPYQKRAKPHDILNLHYIGKDFVFKAIPEEKAAGQKTVVVTHHAPTTLSIHPMYGNDVLNWAYVSDLSNEILDTEPMLWIHGHCHTSFSYKMGETDVITNPRGYQYHQAPPENRDFNPTLRIEV